MLSPSVNALVPKRHSWMKRMIMKIIMARKRDMETQWSS
jgi:hypothetical protein